MKEDLIVERERRSIYEKLANTTVKNLNRRYVNARYATRKEEALSMVKSVEERLAELHAKDFHYLSKCHEVISMTACAEMTFSAALARTESRGFHYREDHPERDDKNWLRWIILKQDGEKMELSTEPIPIEKYKIKPT